ncbi:MAG: diguanylate cyclase [Acidobacteria bacterium]|nr:diguanylate cyclase [Acidobacteriota bacterium]
MEKPRENSQKRWFRGVGILAVLLLLGIMLFLALWASWEEAPLSFSSSLRSSLLALSVLVLSCSAYVLYQQRRIQRLQVQLAEQTEVGIRLQTETQQLQQLAMLDPLTGLYTRHFLEQHLATEVARSQTHGYPLNLLMVDLRHFHQIQAQYGPETLPRVLKEFAERLKKSIRSSDTAVHTGSDKFLVLFTESILFRVPHILARLSGLEVELGGDKIPIRFAAGVTAYQPNESLPQLLERLEREVAEDKSTGKTEEVIRQAKAEIRQRENVEALGRLANKVAHDFNNLLNLVKGYSELALDSLGQSDPLREYLEEIHRANELANSLTRQLLAFTHTDAPLPEMLDLNTLLSEMRVTLQRVIGKEIELVTSPGEETGRVKVVRNQIEQAILNLAVQARDSMPRGGKLTMETGNAELDETYAQWHPGARPGSYVMLQVRDTGAGMNEETLAHIFEPFYIVKKESKGGGLGLAAVYGIVKQSGGYIGVDSKPNQGTTFTIYLPRVGARVGVAL